MDKLIEHLEKMIDWAVALSGDKPLTTLKWDIAQAEAEIAAVKSNKHPDVAKGWPCKQISVKELLERTQNPSPAEVIRLFRDGMMDEDGNYTKT